MSDKREESQNLGTSEQVPSIRDSQIANEVESDLDRFLNIQPANACKDAAEDACVRTRINDYLVEATGIPLDESVDPVEFILASHAGLRAELTRVEQERDALRQENEKLNVILKHYRKVERWRGDDQD